MTIILIVCVFLLLGVAGVLAYFIVNKMESEAIKQPVPIVNPPYPEQVYRDPVVQNSNITPI